MHLQSDRLRIGEIAYLLGYADAAAFATAFKRWEGETPSQYRSRHARPVAVRRP